MFVWELGILGLWIGPTIAVLFNTCCYVTLIKLIDWQQLIQNFHDTGIGVTELASISGCMAKDVCDIINEITLEPPFSTGVKLIDTHSDYFPHKHPFLLEE